MYKKRGCARVQALAGCTRDAERKAEAEHSRHIISGSAGRTSARLRCNATGQCQAAVSTGARSMLLETGTYHDMYTAHRAPADQ